MRLIAAVGVLLLVSSGAHAQVDEMSLRFEDGTMTVEEKDAQFSTLTKGFDGPGSSGRAARSGSSRVTMAKPRIQYEGGDRSEREAVVVDDPLRPGNHVLEMRLSSPNVRSKSGKGDKGRVQLNLYGNRNVQELRQSVRLMLDPDFEAVRGLGFSFNWLTLSEWWNNASWTKEAFPFRISVALHKPDARQGSDLYFSVTAQTLDGGTRKWKPPIWAGLNRGFAVPIGKWMTLDYYFREGDHSRGRFFLSVTVDGQPSVTVFDIHDFTRHPDDGQPDGLSHLNPIKLYSSGRLVNAVKAREKSVKLYWDDLELRVCSAPTPASCPELEP